jgi:predicted PurR-regulated permease PerM
VLECVVIGRCPFPLALAIVLLAVVFVFGAMGSVIGLAIQQLLSTDSTKYIHGIDELFDSVAHLASGLRVNVTGTELYDYAIDSINVEKVLLGEVGAFVNVLGQIGLTMMFLVFLLPARHGDALEHIVGVALPNDPSLVDRVTASLAEMQQQIALYFRVKLLVAFISGAATGVLALCFGFVRCGVVTCVDNYVTRPSPRVSRLRTLALSVSL